MGEIRKVIGENIKKACLLKGIRQVDIAEHLGISQGSVSNWIKGTNSIDIENLAELCAFLGVSLDQIFGMAPIDEGSPLSNDEKELLNLYRSMNEEAKVSVLNTVRIFSGNPSMQLNYHSAADIVRQHIEEAEQAQASDNAKAHA